MSSGVVQDMLEAVERWKHEAAETTGEQKEMLLSRVEAVNEYLEKRLEDERH